MQRRGGARPDALATAAPPGMPRRAAAAAAAAQPATPLDLRCLDGVRALAAVWVVALHTSSLCGALLPAEAWRPQMRANPLVRYARHAWAGGPLHVPTPSLPCPTIHSFCAPCLGGAGGQCQGTLAPTSCLC